MQAGHGQPQGRKQLTPSKTHVGFFLESLLSLSEKSASGTYIMCEDIWLRLKAEASRCFVTVAHGVTGFGLVAPARDRRVWPQTLS